MCRPTEWSVIERQFISGVDGQVNVLNHAVEMTDRNSPAVGSKTKIIGLIAIRTGRGNGVAALQIKKFHIGAVTGRCGKMPSVGRSSRNRPEIAGRTDFVVSDLEVVRVQQPQDGVKGSVVVRQGNAVGRQELAR